MKAYELIDTPEKWCQGYSAERKGKQCFYYDEGADKFCILGAVWRAYGGDDDSRVKALRDKLGTWEIAKWNDKQGRTQAEVYNLLKELDI